jgi:tripartite-type tricarboxylate transporter receptor subunit TctC
MRTSFRNNLVILWGVIFSLHFLFFSSSWSLDYPTKPINLVVSVTAGGPSDLHARILGEAVSKELGVPIVVINKPGVGGGLGASFVANAKPDGYTFLVTQGGTVTSNFALFPNLPYKRTDFLPIFRSVIIPICVSVRADSRWKTLKDLFDEAKKNPGKFRSGSGGTNTNLMWEGLLKHEGIDITCLMYKGAAESPVAILGGHIDCNCDPLTPMIPFVEAGKLRLLAFMNVKRNKNYPDVPTLYELGYPNFSKDLWNGFFAPAGLPQPIMDKVVPVFEKVLSRPDIQARLERVGVFAGFMGPKEFANLIAEEYEFMTELARGIKK